MKRTATILLLLFAFNIAWSQYYPHYYYAHTDALKNIIWEEDFNREKWQSTVRQDSLGYLLDADAILPEGWKFVDSTDNDYHWHWSDVGPRGRYTSWTESGELSPFIPSAEWLKMMPDSASIDNGFLMMESDYFNTNTDGELITEPLDLNAYVEFGPIDFSDFDGAVFNCKIFDRYCCGSYSRIDLCLSSDHSPGDTLSHWVDYQLDHYGHGEYRYIEQRDYFVNVGNDVAGKDSVYFRIWWRDASHYYAIIDDLRFYETPSHNLVMSNFIPDYGSQDSLKYDFTGGYTKFPVDAAGSFNEFRFYIENAGSEQAENMQVKIEIRMDSVLLESDESGRINHYPYIKDTVILATDFAPLEIGKYQISATIIADFVDDFPLDNRKIYEFETTKDCFSRVRHDKIDEWTKAGPRDWMTGGSEGDIIAQRYDIEKPVSFSGVNVYIPADMHSEEFTALQNGQMKMKARAFQKTNNNEMLDLNLRSELYVLSVEDTGSWVYLPFSEGVKEQTKGVFYIGIETQTGTQQELRFEVGSDESGIIQPLGASMWYSVLNESWHIGMNQNYAIDLMVNIKEVDTVGVTDKENFRYLVYPNPFSDFIIIKGESNLDQVQIYNTQGQLQKSVFVNHENIRIATRDLPKGHYVILLKNDNEKIKSYSIIKE